MGGSTVPRRQLGRELRRLRDAAGLKLMEVMAELEWSQSKMWRIETGQVSITKTDLLALCQLYQAPPDMAKVLLALATEGKAKGWWHSFGDVIPEWFEVFVDLESSAEHLRHYDAELVPGLLQTPDYCHAVYEASSEDGDPAELERQVEMRMERQALLTREDPPAPRLDVILNEAAIRRPVGGRDVMTRQLDKLIRITDLPNVSVRVLPFAVGAHAGMVGTFKMLSFPEHREPDVVYVEAHAGALYLEKPKELARYRFIMRKLEQHALGSAATREFIAAAMKEM